MARIELVTRIAAPPARCFDLSRSVEVHVQSAGRSAERAIAGRTSGLLSLGEEVTWRARHFGVSLTLTSRITAFRRPEYFQDSMVRGPLASLVHDHHFADDGAGGTLMRDAFSFRAPFSVFGRLAEVAFLTRHFRAFLEARNREIKRIAESDGLH